MPREKVQVVEIPLFQGISREGPPLERGPGLSTAANIIPDYSSSATRIHQPSYYPDFSAPMATITALGKAGDINNALLGIAQYSYNASSPSVPTAVVFGHYTRSGSHYLGAWRVSASDPTGVALHGNGAAGQYELRASTDSETANIPPVWCVIPWENALYYGHPRAKSGTNHLQRWVPSFPSVYTAHYTAVSSSPLPPLALAEHLDRLWIAIPGSGETTALPRTTRIVYSDPFDTAVVQTRSIIKIRDVVHAMFRPTAGNVDSTVQSHLVLGCRNSIWVYDGDPSYGNSALRVLSESLGILSRTLVQETSEGAIFVGTDGNIYVIPPGATQTVPIGGPVRPILAESANREWRSTAGPMGSLLWNRPYLSYWSTNQFATQITLDLNSPSAATWWGPDSPPTTGVVQFALGNCVNALSYDGSTSAPLAIAGPNSTSLLDVYTLTTAGTRGVRLTSNPLWVPNHDVLIRRVVLVVQPTETAKTYPITVTVEGDQGQSVSRSQPAPIDDVSQEALRARKVVFAFDDQAIRGSRLVVDIQTTVLSLARILKCFVEMWVVPRQDA